MLPKSIQHIENKSKIIFNAGKMARRLSIDFSNRKFMYEAKNRKAGKMDSRYEALYKLKNKYSGERCFILATGPSLSLDDVLLLQDEFTFGMNSICLLFDKTEWRPSIYAIQDPDVYEKVSDVLHSNPQNVFVSDNTVKRFPDAATFNQFPLNYYYNYYDYRYTGKLHVKFSDDAYSVVYDAYSITFSIMQIAMYMGFKEIYLLGCDCNQQVGKKNHFIETGHVEEESKLRTSADRNIFSHKEIKKYCDSVGVKVFNATRGGALEVYPRVQLEDVLRK